MTVFSSTYTSCPHCGGNIDGIYGRFVDPSDPINECRHCGRGVKKPERSLSLLVRKNDSPS